MLGLSTAVPAAAACSSVAASTAHLAVRAHPHIMESFAQ